MAFLGSPVVIDTFLMLFIELCSNMYCVLVLMVEVVKSMAGFM